MDRRKVETYLWIHTATSTRKSRRLKEKNAKRRTGDALCETRTTTAERPSYKATTMALLHAAYINTYMNHYRAVQWRDESLLR